MTLEEQMWRVQQDDGESAALLLFAREMDHRLNAVVYALRAIDDKLEQMARMHHYEVPIRAIMDRLEELSARAQRRYEVPPK